MSEIMTTSRAAKRQVQHKIRNLVYVQEQVQSQIWNRVRDQIQKQVRDQVWNQVWGQIQKQVWEQVRNQVWIQVLDQLRARNEKG